MILVETSQLPSADDITIDSLEYLFAPASEATSCPVPWVEIVSENELAENPVSKESEMSGLLERQLKETQEQLQRVCILLGYTQGLLHERDEQLKVLPDLRFRAAESIALKVQLEKAQAKVRELEEAFSRLSLQSRLNWEEILKALTNPIAADESLSSALMWLGLTGITGALIFLISAL